VSAFDGSASANGPNINSRARTAPDFDSALHGLDQAVSVASRIFRLHSLQELSRRPPRLGLIPLFEFGRHRQQRIRSAALAFGCRLCTRGGAYFTAAPGDPQAFQERLYTAISENTKKLLSQDLEEHSDFGTVNSITFSFSEDWIAINDNKNRVGSASGMVILKNSFLLGLFIAALNDDDFNLPRFILMDNIEDKGMVQERSWNFQRLMIKASEATKKSHQLIFATSKIAPELAGTPLVVGGKYTRERHSLRIQSN
jgi:hypothetical protein